MICSSINNTDCLVIGCGPVGLVTGLWFAKRKYDVVLIEQYSENNKNGTRAFNERHQQVGLTLESMNFLKELDIVAWGEIKRIGCPDGDWTNIPIYMLQNIIYKELCNYTNAHVLFDTKLESVACFNPHAPCRVILTQNNTTVYPVHPKMVVICDGKKDGVAKIFGFPPACKVHLSSYGIVGMIERSIPKGEGSICLKTYSSDSYDSVLFPKLSTMYIRLLGNMHERYIALGLKNKDNASQFANLTSTEIGALLVEAYNANRDKSMNEPEIASASEFSNFSKVPIQICLDYRKETIKLLDGCSTVVSTDGESARSSNFFSGSGLNSGYKALNCLFNFCIENKDLIFCRSNCSDSSNSLVILDQKLLEKDQSCMHISYELLVRGLHYIDNNSFQSDTNQNHSISDDPIIYSISPSEGEVPWFIYVKGHNLVGDQGRAPTITFEWTNSVYKTNNIIVYDNNTIGVKIPGKAYGDVSISLSRADNIYVASPIKFRVLKLVDKPIISNIIIEDEWLHIYGKNFKVSSLVTISTDSSSTTIKAYCNSATSLIISPDIQLTGNVTFTVTTDNGTSEQYTKLFTLSPDTRQSSKF